MPRHHVHFTPTNMFRSSPSEMPPLVMSPSGWSPTSSSSGPYTPPDAMYAGLYAPNPSVYSPPNAHHYHATNHQAAIPRVRRSSTHAKAHTLLAFSEVPLLTYNLTRSPRTLTTPYPHGISAGMLAEPAVHPPQHELTLVSPHLPFSITVVAGGSSGYVTVNDLLEGVYHALRKYVTAAEYSTLGKPKLMRSMARAYERRCDRAMRHDGRRAYDQEKRGGLRQVDFLMGYTKFMGLSPTTKGAHVWELQTG
ncbi:hypothetical protein C8F01DRAFT_984050 [Mycena amicta]|nr:hypothetical protein C8F01DRAFT_984050 [Mycena amicta]